LAASVKIAAYKIDPQVVTQRAAYAVSQRRVTVRPAPETMVWLTALLPVAQGVAADAALTHHADHARSGGDDRTRGQVMADTLVERLTGQTTATGVSIQGQSRHERRHPARRCNYAGFCSGLRPHPLGVARVLVRDRGAGFWLPHPVLRRPHQTTT
jgi:hypothetical protein